MKDMTELKQNVGKRLKEERISRGWKLKDIAAILGISVQGVSNIESGSTMLKYSFAVLIGNAMKIDPDYLLCKTDHRSKWEELTDQWNLAKNEVFKSMDTMEYIFSSAAMLGYKLHDHLEDVPAEVIDYFCLSEDDAGIHCKLYDNYLKSNIMIADNMKNFYVFENNQNQFIVMDATSVLIMKSRLKYTIESIYKEPFSDNSYIPLSAVYKYRKI